MNNCFRAVVALGLCAMLGVSAGAAPQDGKMGGPKMDGKMGGRMGGPGGPGGRMGGPGGRRMRGGGRMMRMAKELGLSDAQKAKLMAMNKAQGPQMKALRDNKSLTEDQKRAKMKTMREANMKKMAAILTPAQRTKMQAMMKKQREERGGRM